MSIGGGSVYLCPVLRHIEGWVRCASPSVSYVGERLLYDMDFEGDVSKLKV
jgi:hypothetical protein